MFKKFKIISLSTVAQLLEVGDWFVILNLQDTYFHIHICPKHRKYLHPIVGHNVYEYIVLPVGLSPTPWMFTKYMVVAVAFLQSEGYAIFTCLDYWLFVTPSKQELQQHVSLAVCTCQKLGLHVNWIKSHLEPQQVTHFIRAILDW